MTLTIGNFSLTAKRTWTMGGFHRGIGNDPKWGHYVSRSFYRLLSGRTPAIDLMGGPSIGTFRRCIEVTVRHRISESDYRHRMGFDTGTSGWPFETKAKAK